ncbi:MAG: hypothetical protein CMN30_02925 [Sandaracinus sp.]|nr:hypothetical protein [Sandaracinus sp.]
MEASARKVAAITFRTLSLFLPCVMVFILFFSSVELISCAFLFTLNKSEYASRMAEAMTAPERLVSR